MFVPATVRRAMKTWTILAAVHFVSILHPYFALMGLSQGRPCRNPTIYVQQFKLRVTFVTQRQQIVLAGKKKNT